MARNHLHFSSSLSMALSLYYFPSKRANRPCFTHTSELLSFTVYDLLIWKHNDGCGRKFYFTNWQLIYLEH
jgi:hypothetical protein